MRLVGVRGDALANGPPTLGYVLISDENKTKAAILQGVIFYQRLLLAFVQFFFLRYYS